MKERRYNLNYSSVKHIFSRGAEEYLEIWDLPCMFSSTLGILKTYNNSIELGTRECYDVVILLELGTKSERTG